MTLLAWTNGSASEYAKVRRLYDQLGIGDRTAIEFFNGGHTINGVGTFDFLHRYLDWPKPGEPRPPNDPRHIRPRVSLGLGMGSADLPPTMPAAPPQNPAGKRRK